jgi:hypothetical protein
MLLEILGCEILNLLLKALGFGFETAMRSVAISPSGATQN